MDSFVHTHVHSQYSLLDGAAKTKELVAAAVADGQPALATTDHGNMYGVIDFYRECQAQGIKYLPGAELYMAKESVSERPKPGKRKDEEDAGEKGKINYHLTLLAQNNTGYKNLIQLSSRAWLEGFYYKPRVDWDILSQHSEGVIATTGCLGGQVLQALLRGADDEAVAIAGRLQDIFGKENLYVEIQDHGIRAQRETMAGLVEVAKKIGAKLLPSADCHYTHQCDYLTHDILLCLQTGAKLSDEKRFRFESDQHYLKSAVEMRELFRDLPGICDNTLALAESCNVVIPFGEMHLPKFPVPEGFSTDDQYLEHLVRLGMKWRWGQNDVAAARVAYELQVIRDMGFSSYFLIMWDLVKHARETGIRTGGGRGSAASSAVSYCLRITEIDPIRYNLPFERFLNPNRVSMPDIDLDVDTRYREHLIKYCTERYGSDKVAQIITFNTIKARAAVKDAGRVLGKPFSLTNEISKAMPSLLMGKDVSLSDCFDPQAERYGDAARLRALYDNNTEAKEVIDVAKGLEGLVRQDGIHAAATVISDVPLVDLVPVQRKKDGPLVTQYEMHAIEELGLLKMDFLGLRNLDVVTECLKLIKTVRFVDLQIENIPLDDERTFQMLRDGQTVGCFQIAESQMRKLIKRLAPTEFKDIAALVALYRPGPIAANMHNDYADRKNHRQPVTYFHPDAEEILRETYGLMIYQEQVMQVAQKFAGYSLGDGYDLIKAIGKKLPEKMAEQKSRFIKGCTERYDAEMGNYLFGVVEKYADYGFNQSHSYSYGMLAYQTAFLKANYPEEYLASLCDMAPSIEKASVYLAEARAMGLDVKGPSVNNPSSSFSVAPGALVVGLPAVRDVGAQHAAEIVSEREQGAFSDLFDFQRRMGGRGLNKKQLISLILAGALDEFGPRKGMISVAEEVISSSKKIRTKADSGQGSFFDQDHTIPVPNVEFTSSEKLKEERRVMGLYVTGHPLDDYSAWVEANSDCSLGDLSEMSEGTFHDVVGVVTAVTEKTTKAGQVMAVVTVEDLAGSADLTLFPRSWEQVSIREDDIIKARVKVSSGFQGGVDLIWTSGEVLEQKSSTVEQEVIRIFLPAKFIEDEVEVAHLKGVILGHPGSTPVSLHLSRKTEVKLGEAFTADPSEKFWDEIKALVTKFTNREV